MNTRIQTNSIPLHSKTKYSRIRKTRDSNKVLQTTNAHSNNVKELFNKEKANVVNWGSTKDISQNTVNPPKMFPTDKKYMFNNSGYYCYVAENGEPYLVEEDVEKLINECKRTGENTAKKHALALGIIRYLDDNSVMFLGPNLSTGENTLLIKSKDGQQLSMNVNEYSWAEIYDALDNRNKTYDYLNKDYWKELFSTNSISEEKWITSSVSNRGEVVTADFLMAQLRMKS